MSGKTSAEWLAIKPKLPANATKLLNERIVLAMTLAREQEDAYFATVTIGLTFQPSFELLVPKYEKEGLALVFGYRDERLDEFTMYVYFDGKKYRQNKSREDARREREREDEETELRQA